MRRRLSGLSPASPRMPFLFLFPVCWEVLSVYFEAFWRHQVSLPTSNHAFSYLWWGAKLLQYRGHSTSACHRLKRPWSQCFCSALSCLWDRLDKETPFYGFLRIFIIMIVIIVCPQQMLKVSVLSPMFSLLTQCSSSPRIGKRSFWRQWLDLDLMTSNA